MMDVLSGREIVGLYLLLKEQEVGLDGTLTKLMMRLEKSLYSKLSIEDFERLGELYRSNVDVFRQKG
jgi:hypothetical protein